MNVHLVSESLFWMEQVQKLVVSLKSSEVYLPIDIRYEGAITEMSTCKMNSEQLCTVKILWTCGALAE